MRRVLAVALAALLLGSGAVASANEGCRVIDFAELQTYSVSDLRNLYTRTVDRGVRIQQALDDATFSSDASKKPTLSERLRVEGLIDGCRTEADRVGRLIVKNGGVVPRLTAFGWRD